MQKIFTDRSNNALVQTFAADAANELTNVSRTGTLTVSGNTPAPATSVTVNNQAAQTYGDFTFARTNLSLANGQNNFTNIAQNAYGLRVTNTLTVNLPQSVTLGFDNNGNLTNDGTRTFSYDSENQLTNVFVAGQCRSDFVYDGLGRRRIARDYAWQSGNWVQTNEVHYVYDGNLPIQERNTNNNVLVTYTRGLDLSGTRQRAGGIGGLLARTDGNGSTFYHSALGNVTALMDGNENIVARYLYNPFGRLTGKWGPMVDANEMQFSSMPQHAGLSLYPFRAYDANLQRWPNRDPIANGSLPPTGLRLPSRLKMQPWEAFEGPNVYSFARNNPVDFVDINGLWTLGLVFDFNFNLIVHLGIHVGGHVGRDPATGKWSAGVIGGPEGGVGILATANATANIMWTQAPRVSCLKGPGFNAGASGTIPPPLGFALGGDVLAIKHGDYAYLGGMAGGGLAAGLPLEIHAAADYDFGWDTDTGWKQSDEWFW